MREVEAGGTILQSLQEYLSDRDFGFLPTVLHYSRDPPRRGGSYGPIHFTYALNASQASASTISTNTTTLTALNTTSPLPRTREARYLK